MWSIIKEILTYLCFICLLYVICFSNTNPNGFYQVQHLESFFLNTRQVDQDYTTITTIDDYWNWLENSFAENSRAQQWYNGEAPRNLSGFVNDKSNRLIGWIIMRQLRVKPQLCSNKQNLILICENDYDLLNEEKDSFQPGWKLNNETVAQIDYSSTILQSFQYQNDDQLDSYITIGDFETYSSGGYVYEFRGRLNDIQTNLSKLHQLGWIDNKTRAVIIEFSLYNPNVQLFTSITLLTEFLSTGGIYPQYDFQPFSFESIIVCSWTSVGIYIWRYNEANRVGDLFKQTNGYAYINLQLAVYINDIYTYIIGFSCFFGTLKLVRFCRLNRRLSFVIETIHHARKDLVLFGMMFSIIFIAFICLFYLLFVSSLSTCATLMETAQMLFEILLMNFDGNAIVNASPFLGPFSFTLFILLGEFTCLNMFITIINDSLRFVRKNMRKSLNEDDMLVYMLHKFQYWIGFGRRSAIKRFEENEERMRSTYYEPVEHFPDKVNQLLDALDKVYIDQQTSIFEPKSSARAIYKKRYGMNKETVV
ncbi:unnamed protein product [Adineta steineri]|uniref:Uncharacterized protein n=1 Tax=Adineta steineri TaxID=433720 RepID=A0A819DAE5_9BILA|nr:unnamed protein product [Adineta steineri]